MHIPWIEVAEYVLLGELEWKMLTGQPVIHKKHGLGVITKVENERNFYVRFEDGNRKPYSFYLSLEYFAPLEPNDELKFKLLCISLSKKAVEHTIDCKIDHPRLTENDIRVALEWDNRFRIAQSDENSIPNIGLENVQDNKELARLLSARAAELAVKTFYERHGFEAEDISGQQILNPESVEWKTHDLTINGLPVDVKNSRRSERNHDVYTEHCIPTFKQNRQGKDVAIVGVLSPLLSPYCIMNPGAALCSTSPTILGATQWKKLQALKVFEKSGVFQIDLRRLGSKASFLPPWVFEFGSAFYKERDEILAQVTCINTPTELWESRSAETLSTMGNKHSIVPILIASGVIVENYWSRKSFRAWEWNFMQKIRSWRSGIGLSLPFLYCTVLTHFLEIVASKRFPPDYSPKEYRRMLFFDHSSRNLPLFIFDPLKTIDALITTLTILWETNREAIRGYHIFRLRRLNILEGKPSGTESDWKTLVAYCGGERGGTKCGLSPLVLGDTVDGKRVLQCPSCGKLICPNCDFCMWDCKRR